MALAMRVVALALVAQALAGCAGPGGDKMPAATSLPTPGAGPSAPQAAEPLNPMPFPEWLAALKAEGAARGLKPRTLAALDGIEPLPRVIELDRRQPEGRATFAQYVAARVTQARIARGQALLAEHRALLNRVAERYGVPPRYILAFWGIETDYGRVTGGFQVLPALATLAYDGRRAAYFRGELFKALEIIDAGDVDPAAMRGSWAGAMGQTQFMPSSYLKFAVDFDGKGRRDIWGSLPDVFASIAHYLAENGWRRGETWGREVRLPPGFPVGDTGLDAPKPLGVWRKAGVKTLGGKSLPKGDQMAALVIPPRGEDRAFLVQDNFKAIRAYNPSHFYALSIGLLADGIGP